MELRLLLGINALKEKAKSKEKKDLKFKVTSGKTSSLAEVITTQQVDTFMRFLRAL